VTAVRKHPGGTPARLALTGLLMALGSAALPAPLSAAELPAFDLQGHRGARGLYPENSLPGFEAALALGVTTLEMDLAVTRDGVVVVHHDRRLDPARTRGPDGAWLAGPAPAIVELNRAALAAYDIGRARPGGKVAKRFPDQQDLDGVAIPTLAEVLALTEARSGGTMRYNMEIKTSPLAPEESVAPAAFATALARALERAGLGARAMVQSFDWRGLKAFQERAAGIPTAYLSAEARWLDNLERGRPGVSPWTAGLDLDDFAGSAPAAIRAAGGALWSPYFRNLGAAELREAHDLGLKVVVWTVNEPAEMAALIELGVDGIVTDYPDRLRRVMAEKGLALPPAFPR
jgi:glycerophosphoryl diester phosphodiesterase